MTPRRRLRRHPAALEITAFLNLIVVLVPFLLSTAVFSRMAVLEMTLPAPASGGPEKVSERRLQLEVVIRAESLEVGDRIGGLAQRIPRQGGAHDLRTLAALLQDIKARFPDQQEARVLAEPDTDYDTLVQVMDTLRAAPDAKRSELFPRIAIGDAPPRDKPGAART